VAPVETKLSLQNDGANLKEAPERWIGSQLVDPSGVRHFRVDQGMIWRTCFDPVQAGVMQRRLVFVAPHDARELVIAAPVGNAPEGQVLVNAGSTKPSLTARDAQHRCAPRLSIGELLDLLCTIGPIDRCREGPKRVLHDHVTRCASVVFGHQIHERALPTRMSAIAGLSSIEPSGHGVAVPQAID
jgi:hypothetical protein